MLESKSNQRSDASHIKMQLTSLVQYLLTDLLTGHSHQADFDLTRAEYIRKRLAALLLVVAPLLILWLGVDYNQVSSEQFTLLVSIRASTAMALLATAYWVYKSSSLNDCKHALFITLFILNAFFFTSTVVLTDSASEGTEFSYSVFPFLYVSMLTIFPLTALESLVMGFLTLITVCVTHWELETLQSFAALADIWFLTLLLLVALWAQMTQLHVLMRLYRQATRDPLTGLLNRRKLMEHVNTAISDSKARGKSAILLLFDLDHFKRINDNFGHQSGDKVLQIFAAVLEANMRDSDSIGRYGGEEFVCMLPCTDTNIALMIAERIRLACEQQIVTTADNKTIRFTTSVGVARYQPPENVSTFIDRADDSLYNAKHEGRNRVVLTE